MLESLYYSSYYHCNVCIVFSLGQYTVPSVSGQCCPPTSSFIIEKVNHNKGIMFGGVATVGNNSTTTDSVYIFNVTHNTIVSYYIVWYCTITVLLCINISI